MDEMFKKFMKDLEENKKKDEGEEGRQRGENVYDQGD